MWLSGPGQAATDAPVRLRRGFAVRAATAAAATIWTIAANEPLRDDLGTASRTASQE